MAEVYTNFTRWMDNYLNCSDDMKNSFGYRTYLIDIEKVDISYGEKYTGSNVVAFRVPGATRGSVEIDKYGNIRAVHFIDSSAFGSIGCYKPEVKDHINEIIGTNLFRGISNKRAW